MEISVSTDKIELILFTYSMWQFKWPTICSKPLVLKRKADIKSHAKQLWGVSFEIRMKTVVWWWLVRSSIRAVRTIAREAPISSAVLEKTAKVKKADDYKSEATGNLNCNYKSEYPDYYLSWQNPSIWTRTMKTRCKENLRQRPIIVYPRLMNGNIRIFRR